MIRDNSGARSRTGCITCRIRKKKCDEQRPACEACRTRQLACYGFNAAAPTWFLRRASWKEVRDSEEAKNLRTLAESRYRIRRKVAFREGRSASAEANELSAGEDEASEQRQVLDGTSRAGDRACSTPCHPPAQANTWQLCLASVWWDSKMQSLSRDASSRPNEEARLLLLFLDVIHPISHSFFKLNKEWERSWMLNRVVSTQALYYSALSISACFEHSLTQPPRVNDIGICPKVRRLQSRAVREVQAQIDEVTNSDHETVEDFVGRRLRLIDAVVHLKTLEIFSMLQGSWEVHHRASRDIMSHIEIHGSPKLRGSMPGSSLIEAILLSNTLTDERRRSWKFCVANFIWMDVLAISTFGSSSYGPCAFDYLGLLRSELIKPEKLMGCQGWILAILVRISRLEQWQDLHRIRSPGPVINVQLGYHREMIAQELMSGAERLDNELRFNDLDPHEQDIRLVSIVWAYATQVFCHVVLSGLVETSTTRDRSVEMCLQKSEELPTRLVMRISWPYTIAGCMALYETQHTRFRRILGKTMQEAQPPGIAWKGAIVMEECWRLRRLHGDPGIGWRDAMASLNARVILT